MLPCGLPVVAYWIFGEALDSSSITDTFLDDFLCAYKEGFTSSISHHSLLYNSIHYLSRIQLLCDEILPNSYTQKNTYPTKLFFHSWLFGSIFVFILSLNHGFIHFCYYLEIIFLLGIQFPYNFQLKVMTHHKLTMDRIT
jgi:hypothetical protein